MPFPPQGVHFVGSLPLDTTESAFKTIASTLAHHVLRCPDGEPAERGKFTGFQYVKFPESMRRPFSPDNASAASDSDVLSEAEIREQLKDLATGYDEAAIASYAIFKRLKVDGTIPKHVKFQVCMPTPTNVISSVQRPYQPLAEEIYRSALLRALKNVQSRIPHHELAIQVDCEPHMIFSQCPWSPCYSLFSARPVNLYSDMFAGAIDFAILEQCDLFGRQWAVPWWSGDIFTGVVDRMLAFTKGTIADDVDMGFHFCYGDSGNKHFIEPRDLGVICEVLRSVWSDIGREVQWVHVPVPKDRGSADDEAYYEALVGVAGLLRKKKTTVYLGLVHAGDEEGTRTRVGTAAKVMNSIDDVRWGVATECGLGRTPRDHLQSILEIAKAVTGAVV